MPFSPPIHPSWHVLELPPDEFKRSRRAIVRVERGEGEHPSIRLKVFAPPPSPSGHWLFIGSFGGVREESDGAGPLYNITAGDMYLRELRGLRIGTWCQNQVMLWLQEQPPGRTRSFVLAAGDANGENGGRRNRFYEQFGSRVEWVIPGVSGTCPEQPTSDFRPLPVVPGIRAIDLGTALATAYSRIEELELEVAASRNQFRNADREMDRLATRSLYWRRICAGAVAVSVLTLWFHFG